VTDVGRAALITAGAAASTLVVDRVLKAAVEHGLDEGAHASPLGIPVTRRTNGRGMSPVLIAAGSALAIGIAGAATLARRPTLVQVGGGLVAGGMLANLTDRALSGDVTDFLPSPLGVLNGADVAIAAGLVLAGTGLVLR
jgi:lipoprotein signal peptidase